MRCPGAIRAAACIAVGAPARPPPASPTTGPPAPPAGAAGRHFKLPPPAAPHAAQRPARSTLVPFGNVPKANVHLFVRTGNIDEAPNEVWLADLTGDLMERGDRRAAARDAGRRARRPDGRRAIAIGRHGPDARSAATCSASARPTVVRCRRRRPRARVPGRPSWRASRRHRSAPRRQRAAPQSLAAERFAQRCTATTRTAATSRPRARSRATRSTR